MTSLKKNMLENNRKQDLTMTPGLHMCMRGH